MKTQRKESIRIERINHYEFRLMFDGEWVTIRRGDVGFQELSHYFPVFKAAHGINHTQALGLDP